MKDVSTARQTMGPLLYYITAHGYGHAVRSCDILNALCTAYPQVPVEVVSTISADFFRNRISSDAMTYRSASFDVGMVQLDSVRVDVDATLERLLDLSNRWDALLAEECRHLDQCDARLVVSDIPSLPLEAAALTGRPGIAIGNFAWNWIYTPFADRAPGWGPLIDRFERGYQSARLLLRLPFAEPMRVFPEHRNLPLVARPGEPCREAMARHTGADPERIWVLLSFTSLDWDATALARIEALDNYAFFTVRPLEWTGRNLFAVDREEIPFARALASVDLVVTKPGYGIVSECIVNRKPMVYVDREDFIEYPILEAAIQRHLAHAHIPSADLYAGRLAAALEGAQAAPWPDDELSVGGDTLAAEILYEMWQTGGTGR